MREPLVGGAERLRLEAALLHPAIFHGRHQSGIFKHPQMLQHGRKRHVEWARKLADRRFACR